MGDKKLEEFAATVSKTRSGMLGAASQASEYLLRATVNIGKKAAARAKELTPKSDPADRRNTHGPNEGHIADGWKAEVTAGKAEVTVAVANTHIKATRNLRLANGREVQYTLLHVLEYGSSEHIILPSVKPALVFFWKKIGKVVVSDGVFHPGTKAYSMMGIATVEANVDTKLVIDALRTTLKLSLLNRTGRLGGSHPFGG